MGGTALALGSIDEVFVVDGLERFACDPASPVVTQDRMLVMRGWAADPRARRSGFSGVLLVDGTPHGTFSGFRPREDVARAFEHAELSHAGFLATLDARDLSPGRHEVRVVLDDGVAALPPLWIDVLPAQSEAIASRNAADDDGATFAIEAFAGAAARAGRDRCIELGTRAIVFGTVTSVAADVPYESYAIVDGWEAFPVQTYARGAVDGTADGRVRTPFLTAFETSGLGIGKHTIAFVATSASGRRIGSPPQTFTVVPMCLERFFPRCATAKTTASVNWADCDPDSGIARPAPRRFSRGAVACVRGWAVDEHLGDSASSVILRFENGIAFRMEARGARPDVATRLALPRALYCGFVGTIATSALPAQRNVGHVYVIAKDSFTAYRTGASIELEIVE